MTTFIVGNESGFRLFQKNTELMFWTDDLLICQSHARGLQAQPFLAADRAAGFGKRGCPFCEGGELHGQFSNYRSRKSVAQALEALAKTETQP